LTGGRLIPTAGGQIVYDSTQGVFWLANANLAADPSVRKMMGVSGIDPNGAMDFRSALAWVAALNAYNNGAGYLGHHNWQLPVTAKTDNSCADTGTHGGSYGPLCQGSALGNLFYIGLKATYPDGILPSFGVAPSPFHNMTLSYYWASTNNGGQGKGGDGGQEMFAFANDIQGGTTTNDIEYYVLPMRHGYIGDKQPTCPPNSKIVTYDGGQAVYDCATDETWLVDANLAASNEFGIAGATTIADRHATLRPPLISHGAMLFTTATRWIKNMQAAGYLGEKDWQLPGSWKDFADLVSDMKLAPGDQDMMSDRSVGPFQNLQPFFYWGCQRGPRGSSKSPCPAVWTSQLPAQGYAPPFRSKSGLKAMGWTFDFGHGVQSTSSVVQKYFVMV